jgi:hypothetical protein
MRVLIPIGESAYAKQRPSLQIDGETNKLSAHYWQIAWKQEDKKQGSLIKDGPVGRPQNKLEESTKVV